MFDDGAHYGSLARAVILAALADATGSSCPRDVATAKRFLLDADGGLAWWGAYIPGLDAIAAREALRRRLSVDFRCARCHRAFHPGRVNQRFCTVACRIRHHRRRCRS